MNIKGKKKWWIVLAAVLLVGVIAFAVWHRPEKVGENLLTNPGFEKLDGSGLPSGWNTDAYQNAEGYSVYEAAAGAHEGEHCVKVENLQPNDARFTQTVKVSSNALYRLSGYIKVEGLPQDVGWGANLSIGGVYTNPVKLYDTQGEWVYTEIYGQTGPDQKELTVFVRLGGYSGESTGSAYFDDISLCRVESIPLTAEAGLWYYPETKDENEDEANANAFWPYLLALSVLYTLLAVALLPMLRSRRETLGGDKGAPVLLAVGLVAAFVVRLLIAARVDGYQVDVGCFLSWGNLMADKGPGQFYPQASYCDYPPAYMYVLGLGTLLQRAVQGLCGGVLPEWLRATMFVKLPPMLCDIGIAALVYGMARNWKMNRSQSTLLSLLTAFNPVLIINSAAWCQVDSVLALLLLVVIYLAIRGNWTLLMPVYVLAVLIKPQALMVGPLGLAVIIMALVRNPKLWKPMLIGVGAALAVALVVVLPFMLGPDGLYLTNADGSFWLTALYAKTLSSYPHATVNTANLYYLFNGNWADLENVAHRGTEMVLAFISLAWGAWECLLLYRRQKKLFWLEPALAGCFAVAFIVMAILGVSWGVVGYTAMALAFAMVLPMMIRSGKVELLPLMGGVLFLLLYVLGTKMHERYLFPAIAMLAVAYAWRRDGKLLALLVLVSCTMFINEGIVLDNSIRLGSSMGHLNNDTRWLNMLLSVMNLGAVVLALAVSSLASVGVELKEPSAETPEGSPTGITSRWLKHHTHIPDVRDFRPDPSLHWKRLDTILVLSITAVFAVLSLCTLGSTKAPQSMWTTGNTGDSLVIDLGDHYDDFTMVYFSGVCGNAFTMAVSDDDETWSEEAWVDTRPGVCYQWKYVTEKTGEYFDSQTQKMVHQFVSDTRLSSVKRFSGRYVRFTVQEQGYNEKLSMGEVVFRDSEGTRINASLLRSETDASTNPQGVLDEQDILEGEPNWYNSAYFDEIYHARTAKELHDGTTVYEWTHPPLGKVIMSWFVGIFGMTPFGWRFAGALMGILMLPAIYLLAKQLTKRTDMALAAMLMFTFDCMHFTQPRLATIDSYPVFFIIVSYFFMARFMQRDITRVPVKQLLPDLALCGFFMGCGIASKWTGVYAACGLAVLYFWTCARHIRMARDSVRILRSGVKLEKEERRTLQFRANHGLMRLLVLCLWCLLFFVVVPVVIYLLSYVPHMAAKHPKDFADFVRLVIVEQEGMLRYHGKPGFGMDHPFYSPWYEWLVIGKPMYYYSAHFIPSGYSHAIFCLGNPAVWYVGLLGLAVCLCVWAKRHVYTLDGSDSVTHLYADTWKFAPAFVLIGYLAQILPWILVPRGTYIYHYFASVPFLILANTLMLHWLTQRFPKVGRAVMVTYLVVCLVFFVIFYPYASGALTPYWWLDVGRKMLNIYYGT